MKPRFAICALILALATLVLLMVRPLARNSKVAEAEDQPGSPVQPSNERLGRDAIASERAGAEPSGAGPAPNGNSADETQRELASKEWVEAQNAPVGFYGI